MTTATDTCTFDWLNRALDGIPVWDLGQLSKLDKRVLSQAVRAGRLCSAKASWFFLKAPKRTVWYRPDSPPQEVLAEDAA